MRRVFATFCLLSVSLFAPLAHGAAGGSASEGFSADSPSFGAPGLPHFDAYALPANLANSGNSGEPTIGIPFNSDHLFFQSFTNTHKAVFDDAKMDGGKPAVTWTDVTPPFSKVNIDPMLVADQSAGRVFAGGLDGPCSVMGLSDDDGKTWVPAVNMCSGSNFDHQSVGAGAWAPDIVPRGEAGRATYYCGQGGTVSCATSLDGGHVWLPWIDVTGGCHSFHGHIKVSEVSGTAVLPFADCGGVVGFGYTSDNGLTWNSRKVPGSRLGQGIGFDPSAAFTKSGWLFYAHANDLGIYVGLSKDEGQTWLTLGNNTAGVQPSQWLNLSAAYRDPVTHLPLRYANFVNTVAGDDDRAALTFLGATDAAGKVPWQCGHDSDSLVWHYYLAQTFDAGATWTVSRVSEDPVQIGGMYDGSGGSSECRNLLDFDDAQVDSHGRIHIGFADGCIDTCAQKYANGDKPAPGDSRSAQGAVLRQTTGRGVLAAFDAKGPAPTTTSHNDTTGTSEVAPGFEPVLALGALTLAVAIAVSRRRHD
jgi:hypothetical protein